MKYTTQLNEMKKLSNYSRNYHDYRQRLRNASAPGVPFLGMWLFIFSESSASHHDRIISHRCYVLSRRKSVSAHITDQPFEAVGQLQQVHEASSGCRRLLSFPCMLVCVELNIRTDVRRFQVPYNLRAIPEVQQYLHTLFQVTKRSGDLQELYRRR